MTCEEVCEKISQLVKGDLSLSEKNFVENHLQKCPNCNKEWVKHTKLVKGLKSFYTKLDLGPNRSIHSTLPSGESKSSPFSMVFFQTYGFPAVFLGLVVVLSSFFVFQYQSTSFPPPAPTSHQTIFENPPDSSSMSLISGEVVEEKSRKLIKSRFQLVAGKTYCVTAEAILSHPTHATICLPVNAVFQAGINSLILHQGGVRIEGHLKGGRFQLTIPHAVLRVLGTRFDVMIDGAFSFVQLFEGTLLVEGKGGKLTLNPGEVCWVNDQKGMRTASASSELWPVFQKSVTDPKENDLFLGTLKKKFRNFSSEPEELKSLVASSADTPSTISAPLPPIEKEPGSASTSDVASSSREQGTQPVTPQDSSTTFQVQTPEEGGLK